LVHARSSFSRLESAPSAFGIDPLS
jgi:hypothetical protein